MTAGTEERRMADVDVRQRAGIVRSALDEIKAIQSLLDDVYKDAGDGRTLFRELVQNADDAGARQLSLTVLERGWPNAPNSLLRGPALLVSNDGAFPDKDREALHKAIGGSKESDADKIGTFGIGLKSVFHICEAFAYIGADHSGWRAGILNPWAGTGEDSDVDPLHPDWDKVDVDRLRSAAADLVGDATNFLVLWIPLRRPTHLDRGAAGRRYGLREHCPKPDDPCAWFGRSPPAALLAQCGNLQTIQTDLASAPESLRDRQRLMHVTREPARWVGRPRDDSPGLPDRPFEGAITSDESSWTVVGVEALGSKKLRRLRSEPDWPQYPLWEHGRHSNKPRQALAHAAVTVLRPRIGNTERVGTRLRWAVFLPLDDNPDAISGEIVESEGPAPAWEILLHGYFWPSQDRRSIPGVTDRAGNAASDAMRTRWNRALCNDLLFPLLPSTLANAVDGVDERAVRRLLKAVVNSEMVKSRRASVTQRHWLLPVVAVDGVQWQTLQANARPVSSVANWSQAPEAVRRNFVASCDECTDDVVFIEDDAPRLAGELDEWTDDRLERLLNCIPAEAFGSAQSLRWIDGLARHVLGSDVRGGDNRAATVAKWLARKIGEGALAPTTRRSISRELRYDMRDAWQDLCEALPRAWLVETPVNSLQAVAELAAEGMFGDGLLPLPFGRTRGDVPPCQQLDQERLDRALSALGHWLEVRSDSERSRHSRLLLAEALLAKRDDRPLGDLAGLPLLRATRLPDDRDEAWSISQLRRQMHNCRVFASPASEVSDESADGTRPERRSDPKRAVTELAEALDEAVWLLSGDTVASVAEVPPPIPGALATAVLRAETFANPEHRRPVVERLAPDVPGNADVRLAARALLAGCAADVVGRDTELFYYRNANGRALRILLDLLDRPWRAVQRESVQSLAHDIIDALGVVPTDLEALHRLLGDCLHEPVDWTMLSDVEALHLLQRLYGAEPEAQRRWRTMPLHRGVDGRRAALDDRARRSTSNAPEQRLPPELEAEVRLLHPEPEVAHLYDSVPEMDRDGILQLMLEGQRSWRFAERIAHSIHPSKGPVLLPQDDELRDLLRRSPWLPRCDGGGLAPDQVLIAPKELTDAVRDLASAGAFGDNWLPEAIDAGTWATVEPVVRGILGRLSRERQVQRVADAVDPERVAQVARGAWLVMPSRDLVDASLIIDARQTTLAGSHAGWTAVHAAAHVVDHDAEESRDSSEALVALARSLCGPIPATRQIEILTSLAKSRPAKDSPTGRLFRRYLECLAATGDFFPHVLSEIELPTQDGNWHVSRDVARSETGVARRHRLIPELRPILRLSGDDPVPHASGVRSSRAGAELDTLERYFEPWRNRIPRGAVGAFLSLFGNGLGNVIAKLAEQWLGQDVAIEPIPGLERHAVSVWVSPRIAHGDRVSAVNVLGARVEMAAEISTDTLFAIDPVRRPASRYSAALAPLGDFWEVALRDVQPGSRSKSDLTRLLGGTVERWASEYLKLDREQVKAWWSRWAEGSQVDIGPVLASIKAHLPLTLQQLDVRENEPLQQALREAERAQRRREQAPSDDTISSERRALDRLVMLIEEPDHQTFLWTRVNELMRRYGYGEESVLLELAQNADDALAQAAEIKGEPLPATDCRLLIRVHEHDDRSIVDVVHWGRPINDIGRTPAGRDRQWDQDLYFMMLMNLSGKPGEAPGSASASSSTGRFGLGFKSVHLASPSPSVVSGFIGFSIAGGLLPQEPIADDADPQTTEYHRETRIRLPLRQDVDAGTLIERLFQRFAYARTLLPVLARQVREVVVEGGSFPGVHLFEGKPIDGAPGWSVGAETALPNHAGRWRILRFRPADAGRQDLGTTALAVGLHEGVPKALGADVPFLWNVTPTSESWGCGYVVNGPFKLDPGRTHVSLDDDTTLRTANSLGDALGKGLIELHDVLADTTVSSHHPVIGRGGREFLSSLWMVLASGTDTDTLRRSFLSGLHSNGRGLAAWMAARSVVPTGLPDPFPSALPPLDSATSWEVAVDGLDSSNLCAALARIDDVDFTAMVESRAIASEETAALLRPLRMLAGTAERCVAPTRLRPADLFAELAERWNHWLTPERLHALRPISAGEEARGFFASDRQGSLSHGRLKARAADGIARPLPNLLLRDAPGAIQHPDVDVEDELLRAAFAPDECVLDPAYVERSEDWRVFRVLRVQHRVDAAMMAKWCLDLPEDRQPSALHYLLHGELGLSVLPHLVPTEGRPHWLREYDDACRLLDEQREESWRRQPVLAALFPERFGKPELPAHPTLPEPDTFFQQLSAWWDKDVVRDEVITAYESRAWPEWLRRDGLSASLQAGSVDHWLALLVLGACRSLGRARDDQHRGFIEFAHREGWWEVFTTPDDANAWMKVLENWQDDASDKLTYLRWMSLFPMVYQFSRYQGEYVRLLKSAGRRPQSRYQVTDQALTGAGTQYDAPPAPLNMGLHWILRELVRLEVVEGDLLFPDCWVPNEHVLRLLNEVGLDQPDDSMTNSQKARAIFDFLSSGLQTKSPSLHLAFDIPLRHVAANERLRRKMGLGVPDSRAFNDERSHRTSRGEPVRSKSEVIIANELRAKGIDYRYEAPLRLRNGTLVHPDFTIVRPGGGHFYWEHAGMLDDPNYRQRWEDKLTTYRRSGIVPVEEGGTLIVTRDHQGDIDSREIINVIHHHLSFSLG